MASKTGIPSFGQIYANAGFQKDYSKKNRTENSTQNTAGGSQAARQNSQSSAPTPQQAEAESSGSSAYERLMNVYSAALDAQRAQRRAAYEAAVKEQQRLYEQNAAKVNDATDKALREAYVNKMQSQRTMSQQLAAQGLNGGYSETTAAGLQNNYGNARNELETERTSQLNDLNMTLQNNLASARKILDSGNAGDYKEYLTDVAKLIASNPTAVLSMEQGGAGSTDSGKGLYQLYQELVQNGASTEQAMQVLYQQGYDIRQLFA